MLRESALCLALDQASLTDRAGVLTPATAMGLPLVEAPTGGGAYVRGTGSTARRGSF